jgi:Domain of unknown function (DUF4926)
MNSSLKLLDVIALTENLPDLGLYRGQVGTIVEVYEPGIFEVEFSDTQGQTYALETLQEHQLMVLHHQPIAQAA